MKKTAMLFVLVGTIIFQPMLFGQANPRGVAGHGEVSIEYGRPSAKGREVMELITPGSHWRMGADGHTILTTKISLLVGEVVVPSGKYALLAKFTEDSEWKLILCKEVARGFKPKDIVVVIPLKLEKSLSHVEQMTITLKEQGSGYQFVLSWGKRLLIAKFSKNIS